MCLIPIKTSWANKIFQNQHGLIHLNHFNIYIVTKSQCVTYFDQMQSQIK